jgi:hypothetical protein
MLETNTNDERGAARPKNTAQHQANLFFRFPTANEANRRFIFGAMNEALQLPLPVRQRYAPLLPVLVLAACCISTIVAALGYNFELDAKNYGAFTATAATVASFFWLRKYYKYFLSLIFLLGLCGLLNFTVVRASVGFNFGEIQIGLSPLMLIFGLVACCFNAQKVKGSFIALVKPSDEKIAQQWQEEVAEFKSKFSWKTTEELKQIVAANKLVPPALTAARQLIQERSEVVTNP